MYGNSDTSRLISFRTVLLLVAIVALSIAAYGCSGARPADSSSEGNSRTTAESSAVQTTIEETTGTDVGQENASPDEVGQADGSQNSSASGDAGIAISPSNRVRIELEGDEEVRFSGSCRVNGERERLKGEVPQVLTYDLGKSGSVECVIKKRGGEGTLKVTTESGGRRTVQQTNAVNGEIRIGFSGDGSMSSMDSSTSSVVSQQSSSSVTITKNDSSGGEN